MKKELLFSLLLVGASTAHAAPLRPNPSEIIVFKNGFGVVTYGFKPASDNFEIDLNNRASHGTVWFRCNNNPACASQIRSKATIFETPATGIASPRDLLPLAEGKVRLTLGEKATVEGDILRLYHSDGELPLLRPAQNTLTTVVLKTSDGKVLALNASEITQVEFTKVADLPAFTPGKRLQDQNQTLAVNLHPGSAKSGVNLHALEYGYTWAPSYHVQLQGEDQALVELKATVFNEGMDMKGTKISLAAGWANLNFKRLPDAMHTTQNLGQYLNGLNGGDYSSPRRESPVAAQRMMSNVYAGSMNDEEDYSLPAASATQKEDLHLYYNKAVDLKAGDRLSLQLFAEKVWREHVYEWEVPDTTGRGKVTDSMFLTHKMRLKNSTGAPWTTAPIAITKDGSMVAQSIVNYTPKGGTTEVEVSRALDFALSAEDTLISKDGRDVVLAGRTRMRVPGEGKMVLKNLRPHAVKIVVKKTVYGIIAKTSPQAKVNESTARYAYENPTSQVRWETVVKPGETTTFTYNYTTLQD